MSKDIVILEHGRAYARAFILTIVIAGALAVAPIQAVFRSQQVSSTLQKCFCRLVCWIIGIRIAPVCIPSKTGPLLIVTNHVSWTDIITLASLFPMKFLAKKEVASWPLLGKLAKLQGTVFLERGDNREIFSINAALADVLLDGANLVVFPEGTSTHGVLEPKFHSSHFQAAQLAEVPVLPAAILYTDETGQADVGWYRDMEFIPHLWRILKKGGFVCHIAFGEPIDSCGKDRKTLASEAQGQVRDLLIAAIKMSSPNDALRQQPAARELP